MVFSFSDFKSYENIWSMYLRNSNRGKTQEMTSGIFTTLPENFAPTVHVSGVFCTYQDRFLIIKRATGRPQAGTWGIPSGKKENEETSSETAIRELYEETRISVEPQQLSHIETFYIRLPSGLEYVYTVYVACFQEIPEIALNQEEHTEAQWITSEDSIRSGIPLIYGAPEVIASYVRFMKK